MRIRSGIVALVGALVTSLAVPAAAELGYPDAVRIDASNPVDAAILVSQQLYPDGAAGAVVLARSDNFPDALGAAALTTDVDGPLLLTSQAALDPDVEDEVKRVLPTGGTVFLLGGTNALSSSLERRLDDLGFRTPRFPGRDRIETAAMIARYVGAGPGETAVLVRARGNPDQEQGWVDSVSCGAWAANTGTPILLTDSAAPTVAAETLRTIDGLGVRRVVICGGTGAVAAGQETQLRDLGLSVDRYAGDTRVTTAVDVAKRLWGVRNRAGRQFVLVPGFGTGFGYGLAAAPLAGRLGAPILLAAADAPTACGDPRAGETLCYLEGLTGTGPKGLTVVGARGVIADPVLEATAVAAGLEKDTTPPPVPRIIDVVDRPEDDGSVVDVVWSEVQDPSQVRYELYVSAAGATPRVADRVTVTAATSFLLTGLTAGTTYDLRVTALDDLGNRSAYSEVTGVTPVDEVPAAPTVSPNVAPVASGLQVSWVESREADVAGYVLERATEPLFAGDNCANLLSGSTTWTRLGDPDRPTVSGRSTISTVDTTVESGSSYCYRFAPVDTTGNQPAFSPPSAAIEA